MKWMNVFTAVLVTLGLSTAAQASVFKFSLPGGFGAAKSCESSPDGSKSCAPTDARKCGPRELLSKLLPSCCKPKCDAPASGSCAPSGKALKCLMPDPKKVASIDGACNDEKKRCLRIQLPKLPKIKWPSRSKCDDADDCASRPRLKLPDLPRIKLPTRSNCGDDCTTLRSKINIPQLPKLRLPKRSDCDTACTSRPKINIPQLPKLRLPKRSDCDDACASRPKINIPKLLKLRLPKRSDCDDACASLPKINIPKLPKLRLPTRADCDDCTTASRAWLKLPCVKLPKLQLPRIDLSRLRGCDDAADACDKKPRKWASLFKRSKDCDDPKPVACVTPKPQSVECAKPEVKKPECAKPESKSVACAKPQPKKAACDKPAAQGCDNADKQITVCRTGRGCSPACYRRDCSNSKAEACRVAELIYKSMTACYARQRKDAIHKLSDNFSCTCHPDVMAALIYALNDSDERVRAKAADEIGDQIRESGGCCCCKEVVAALKCALCDCDWQVRRQATEALKLCGYEVTDCGCRKCKCNLSCGDGNCDGCDKAPSIESSPGDKKVPPTPPVDAKVNRKKISRLFGLLN